MSTCSRCGNPIEFRYVNGRCVPMHLNGGCIGYGSSRVDDYAGYQHCNESTCFCTNCPECGDEVFFIRYNGGSVWIDPPLGPPWYKHACFDHSPSKGSLVLDYELPQSHEGESHLIIGVVTSTSVNFDKSHTNITIETGKAYTHKLKMKNNAGYLLGKLCIYNNSKSIVWPVDEPSYIFEAYRVFSKGPK